MPNLLIADDHQLVCETIASYLSLEPDFDVRTASSVDEALAVMANDDVVDLVILDYKMPGIGGLDGLRTACSKFTDSKIVLMSGVAPPCVIREALSCGAQGYLPKSLPANQMIRAIRKVLNGGTFVPSDYAEGQVDQENHWGLTPRELQVLERVCLGWPNKEIVNDLGVQLVTVKLHVANILTKMGADNRTQAAVLAKEHHLF